MRAGEALDALSLLIKPVSGRCNMRCVYCFYADVAQSRDTPNRGLMSMATLETIVKKAFSEATRFVSFSFQGGEPMLAGLDFFRIYVALEREYNRNGVEVFHAIQTNGTLIDDEWAQFFGDNDFLVGLSVDGCRDVHDALRPDACGNGTHNCCMKAAELLKKRGAAFNILSVLTKHYAQHPDKAYQFYKKNNFRYIQLIPCLDRLDEPHGSNPYSLSAALFGTFLCRFFDLWYADFIEGNYYSVRMFDNYVRMLMGEPPENCGMRGVCSSYPVIEADGSVYPCDFYVLDECKIGDVHTDSFKDMLTGSASEHFMKPSRAVPEICGSCPYIFICRGGCRRDRPSTAAEAYPLNCYCEGYKEFFGHALPRLMDIARKMPQRV